MTRICLVAFLFVLLAEPARAGDPESVQDAIARIQKVAARPHEPGFRDLFAKGAFGTMGKEEAEKQRLALARELQAARITEVREKRNWAAATLKTPGDERAREVFLRREGEQWRISSGRTYVVVADTKEPAKVYLTTRTSNGPYGLSAYCFTYVTRDPALCKNRMDIWLCHNGEFHTRGEGRIIELGIKSLKNVTRVPLHLEWKRTIACRPHYSYVLHCRDPRDRDFFVKFKVARVKRGTVLLEWALLATGRGAPKDIREAQPLVSDADADAPDALCAKGR